MFLTLVLAIIAATNSVRISHLLPPLSVSSQLTQAAQMKADDLVEYNYWSHTSPQGVTGWDFIQKAGYNYSIAGENLAQGFNSAENVMAAWMNSTSHRNNILSSSYCQIGVAVAQKGDRVVVVQIFACPQISNIRTLPNLTAIFSQSYLAVNLI